MDTLNLCLVVTAMRDCFSVPHLMDKDTALLYARRRAELDKAGQPWWGFGRGIKAVARRLDNAAGARRLAH